ncbi:transmembrane channel-like protein 6 [Echinops telfairi]|uniref:Transmembrane channel-like protein 6 n=1 Tax=Echinops telfairi TaxID=9371 RepID=A0AC55DUM6_ECHTE|nr:transmembrane channel-like protein 6 [Echinops telfairi]
MAFALEVPETLEDWGQEPSPYDEDEVHHSFHQLIQEQSQWAGASGPEEAGLELQEMGLGSSTPGAPGGDQQVTPGLGDTPVYSAATLRILASMPSRTIGRSRGAIISQYYNRTVRLRRRRASGQLPGGARPSLRAHDLELDPTARNEEEKRSLLIRELRGLTGVQQDQMLRGMPLSLAEKRCLREESQILRRTPRDKVDGRGVWSCCSQLKYGCVLAMHSLWLRLLGQLPALKPWHYALKRIGGQFGSSVLSYFLFLKTLLVFNALLLLPLLAFIVGVGAAFPPEELPRPTPTFTGLELLTGGGYFTSTVMYYGYYSNTTLNEPCTSPLEGSECTPEAGGLPYSMPLAYLFTVGAAFFITCITLVYSMSRSFGESYRVDSNSAVHAITTFCSWDYKVTQKWASRLQQDNLRTQLKELLAEWQMRQDPQRLCARLRSGAVLACVWLLCLGITLACALALTLGMPLPRLVSEKKMKRQRKPEFDIARNVLELIYGQTLTWLGVLFSPLLPAVQILKLLLLFNIKKTSLMANCQAPRRPWLAARMSTVFATLLCFPAFLGAAIFLCYVVWQVKPSSRCGPFQGLDTMYEAGKVWVLRLERAGPQLSWLPWLYRYLLENTFIIFLLSALLLAVIYLNIQVVKGQREVICLLKEQISNEGDDKIFLINKIHSVYDRKEQSRGGPAGSSRQAQASSTPLPFPKDPEAGGLLLHR